MKKRSQNAIFFINNLSPLISLFCWLFFLVNLFSCHSKQERQAEHSAYKQPIQNNHFIINKSGDSIPTNVPILAKGKRIDPKTVAKPRVVPYEEKQKFVPTRKIEVIAGSPKVIKTPEKLPKVIIGEADIPIPEKVIAKGKVIPALQPKPIPALLPQMKDNATLDIQYLDIDQNMATPSVWTMMEDSRGNLWFGTMGGGASRYDGTYFTHFTKKEGLSGNHIFSMLEDSRGNLWFGTRNGGVSRYDGQNFTHFTTEGGVSHNFVMAIVEDSNGNLWFGTGNGASLYDGTHFTHFTTETGLVYSNVISLFEDSHKNIWIGTGNGTGLHRYDGKSITHYNLGEGQGQNDVHTMIEDRKGNLWFGTWGGGLIRFDGIHFEKFTTAEGLNDNTILSILEDKDGTIWLGGINNGVSQYTGKHFIHYTAKDGLSSKNVKQVFKDSKDNLWACTWDTGVNRINTKGFKHFTTTEGLHQNKISSILKDRTGTLWFGTNGGNLSNYDGDYFKHYTFSEGVIYIGPNTMYEDKQGNLWFGTGNGVSRFDGENYMDFTPKEGLSGSDVRAILEDSKGDFWFGNQTGGITRYDGKYMTHYTEKEGFISDDVFAIFEDSKHNLWFGTLGGGVSRFDGKYFIHYTTNEGLSDNFVRTIIEDKQGNLWFGTEDGLNRFDGQQFIQYTTEDGLAHNYIFALTIDDKQNIWATTEKGITVLTKKTSQPNKSSTDEYRFYSFKKEDGLKKTDFTFSDIVIDDNNQIWFGSSNGLKMLDLNDFELPTTPPEQVQLSRVEINEQFLDFRQLTTDSKKYANLNSIAADYDSVQTFYNYPLNLSLPYDQNHLTFYFSAIDWTAANKIKYSYQLEGLEKDWSAPQSTSQADYRSLPYGTYTFKVKAIGKAQIWSKPFEYTFTIQPPWWYTWWAYTLYVLTTVGLTGWYIQRIRRQLKKEQSFNQQLAQANHQLQVLNIANSRFVPNDFLKILRKESLLDLQLGDQMETTMTILFADIRDYTTLSEQISPEDNFKLINAFLGRMGPIIEANGGFICQYMGDGFMALFKEKHELAISAAIEMQLALQRYNKKRFVRNRQALRLGIGLNTGKLMLGVIGDKNRYDSSVISDAVNTASRMEGLTKIFGCQVIVSEKTLAEIEAVLLDDLPLSSNSYRFLGKVKVKGKNQTLKIYDFFDGDTEKIRQIKADTKADFEKAIRFYFDRKFGKSADLLKKIAKKFPEDVATEYYLTKAVRYVVNGVDVNWSGVEEIISK